MAEIINVNDITNGSISNGEWAGTNWSRIIRVFKYK